MLLALTLQQKKNKTKTEEHARVDTQRVCSSAHFAVVAARHNVLAPRQCVRHAGVLRQFGVGDGGGAGAVVEIVPVDGPVKVPRDEP